LGNLKTLLSEALGFGLASFLTKVAALLIVPVLTHNLLPDQYGALELIVGFGVIMSVLVSLSLESYIARQWGETDDNASHTELLSSTMCVAAVVATLLVIVSLLMQAFLSQALFETDAYASAISFITLYGALVALLSLPMIALRMQGKLKWYLILVTIQSGSYLCGVHILKHQENITVENIAKAMLLSIILTLLLGLFSMRRYLVITFRSPIIKKALRYSIPLLPAVAITWVNGQVDKYAILYFIDVKTVGEFALIMKLSSVLTMAVVVFTQTWLPYSFKLTKLLNYGEEQFKKVMCAYYIFGLFACLILVLFSRSIFSLIAPEEYEVNLRVLPVLLLAALVYGSASIANVGMLISGKTEWNSYAALIGVMVNIVLTCWLVPIWGVEGAAWGSLAASVIFVMVLAWRTTEELKIDFKLERVFLMCGLYLFCAFAVI
jgi:O-antigen/teichoic acid export membrane protein